MCLAVLAQSAMSKLGEDVEDPKGALGLDAVAQAHLRRSVSEKVEGSRRFGFGMRRPLIGSNQVMGPVG